MMRTNEVAVRQDELVGAREAARGFSGIVQELEDGNRRLAAILHRNRLAAVMLSAGGFEAITELCEAALAWEQSLEGWEQEPDGRLEAARRRFIEARDAFLEWRAR